MNKDQVKGRVEAAKGKVKEELGDAADDTSTELEGKVQKNVGKARAGMGDAAADVKKKVDKHR